ncbi:hypothetical protein SHKM778_25590 [Streptomyces sp. KM77-8]|uniref:assimilatory sulfite reductase (ferredoxin) n=1 Tax=Streptomyces haneummycinicus TaxID=3074435 RepID=A0AAT9HFV0_9ACTN
MLEKEYLGRRLADGPAPVLPASPVDHIGVHKQRDGLYYVGAAPVVGRVSGTRLAALADTAEAHGSDRLRLTPYQKVLVLDVADPEPLVRDLETLDLRVDASPWRRATMACTGLEYCKLAIVETKARAAELVTELERRLGDQRADITINLNGCPNACARTQVADIGLKGQLLPGPDGTQVEGFQVHLGGALSSPRRTRLPSAANPEASRSWRPNSPTSWRTWSAPTAGSAPTSRSPSRNG